MLVLSILKKNSGDKYVHQTIVFITMQVYMNQCIIIAIISSLIHIVKFHCNHFDEVCHMALLWNFP